MTFVTELVDLLDQYRGGPITEWTRDLVAQAQREADLCGIGAPAAIGYIGGANQVNPKCVSLFIQSWSVQRQG